MVFNTIHPIFILILYLCFGCEEAKKISVVSQSKSHTQTQAGDETVANFECDFGYKSINQSCQVDVNLDLDRDGVPNAVDNCINVQNAGQDDCDYDGEGDVCDENSMCGASLSGYVQYFKEGELTAFDFPYPKLEIERVVTPVSGDEFGQYRVPFLPIGQHKIMVYKTLESIAALGDGSIEFLENLNHNNQGVFNQAPLLVYTYDVTSDQIGQAFTQDLLISPTGSIGGRITRGDQDPLASVHDGIGVYIKELPNLNAVTNSAGFFMIKGVPEGRYTIHYVSQSYQTLSHPIEVIGLESIDLNQTQGTLTLTVDDDNENTWTQEIRVEVSTDSTIDPNVNYTLDVVFVPIFPHLTPFDPQRHVMTLSQTSFTANTLIFSSNQLLTHASHDIFNISVSSPEIRGSRHMNVAMDQNSSEIYTTVLQAREFSKNEYAIRDHDGNGVSNEEQADMDGDGCIENDQFPHDPFVCNLEPLDDPVENFDLPEFEILSSYDVLLNETKNIELKLQNTRYIDSFFHVELVENTNINDEPVIQSESLAVTSDNQTHTLTLTANAIGQSKLKIWGVNQRSQAIEKEIVINVIESSFMPVQNIYILQGLEGLTEDINIDFDHLLRSQLMIDHSECTDSAVITDFVKNDAPNQVKLTFTYHIPGECSIILSNTADPNKRVQVNVKTYEFDQGKLKWLPGNYDHAYLNYASVDRESWFVGSKSSNGDNRIRIHRFDENLTPTFGHDITNINQESFIQVKSILSEYTPDPISENFPQSNHVYVLYQGTLASGTPFYEIRGFDALSYTPASIYQYPLPSTQTNLTELEAYQLIRQSNDVFWVSFATRLTDSTRWFYQVTRTINGGETASFQVFSQNTMQHVYQYKQKPLVLHLDQNENVYLGINLTNVSESNIEGLTHGEGGMDLCLTRLESNLTSTVIGCLGTSGNDYIRSITSDGNHIYMCGTLSESSLNSDDPIVLNDQPIGLSDIFVAKYNSMSGSFEWVKRFGTHLDDVCNHMIYIEGALYVAGTWGRDSVLNTSAGVVMKLDMEGNEIEEARVILQLNDNENSLNRVNHLKFNEQNLVIHGESGLSNMGGFNMNSIHWLSRYTLDLTDP